MNSMGTHPVAATSASAMPIMGAGDFTYEVTHGWGQLPDHIRWGETHGVAIDSQGFVYLKHKTRADEAPMDSIAVFDPTGKFVRSWGQQYHGGGHGIDIRREGNEEFLYLCVSTGRVVKATLSGEEVWVKGRPLETGKYDDPQTLFKPTNIAFAPDGGFYVADGYGAHYVHQYDQNANWVRSWGGFGEEPGQFKTPHGIWLDDRPGRDPVVVVCDRGNARLQLFSLDGNWLRSIHSVLFPGNIDIQGDVLVCADLHARVTFFDRDFNVLAHLADDADWTKQVLGEGRFPVRSDVSRWRPGYFIHPHDVCFDKDGNLFVLEWVPTGRVNFLKKIDG